MSSYTTVLLSCGQEDAKTALLTVNQLLNDKRQAQFIPFLAVTPGLCMFSLRKNWLSLRIVIEIIEAVPWRDVVQVWSKKEEYADRFTESELNVPRFKTACYMDRVLCEDGEYDDQVDANCRWEIKSTDLIIPRTETTEVIATDKL